MDNAVLLENKLRNAWSAPEFATYLSHERLEYICKEFNGLQIEMKVRILLSLLSLSIPQLKDFWKDITNLLQIAGKDKDQWVRVTLTLVKNRLPSLQDILGEVNGDVVDVLAVENREENLFYKAVADATDALASSQSSNKHSISPEWVPFEWPYLCSNLIDSSVKFESENIHFKPIPKELQEAYNSKKRNSAIFSASPLMETPRSTPGAQMTPEPSSVDEKQNTPTVIPTELEDKIPSAIKDVLNDPENKKLTDESRFAIFQFYNETDPTRPKSGVRLCLLSETREYVDDNTAILTTQINLKLNYDDNSAKRVKSKKKYKLKG